MGELEDLLMTEIFLTGPRAVELVEDLLAGDWLL